MVENARNSGAGIKLIIIVEVMQQVRMMNANNFRERIMDDWSFGLLLYVCVIFFSPLRPHQGYSKSNNTALKIGAE